MCNEYKTIQADFQQNGKLFNSSFYLVTTEFKTSDTNDNCNFFLTDSHSTNLTHHTNLSSRQSVGRGHAWVGKLIFFLPN